MFACTGDIIPRDTGEGPGMEGEAGQLRVPGEGIASCALPEAKGEPTPSSIPGRSESKTLIYVPWIYILIQRYWDREKGRFGGRDRELFHLAECMNQNSFMNIAINQF